LRITSQERSSFQSHLLGERGFIAEFRGGLPPRRVATVSLDHLNLKAHGS
jgi:hypothetical protein